MEAFITHRARVAASLFLLVGLLSGCSSLMGTPDGDQVICPSMDLPANQQPFDTLARRQLQSLIDRNNDAFRTTAENPAFVRLNDHGDAWQGNVEQSSWACVLDKRTNLIWEVKTDTPSLRGQQWTYSWYEPALTGAHNYAGKANGGKCYSESYIKSSCDTQAYVAAVNAVKLCGHSDWRLPNNAELRTLLDRNENCPGECVDLQVFPNTAKGGYWTSSQFGEHICYAWGVDFELGDASGANKNTPLFVRLVRGKWHAPVDENASVDKNVPFDNSDHRSPLDAPL